MSFSIKYCNVKFVHSTTKSNYFSEFLMLKLKLFSIQDFKQKQTSTDLNILIFIFYVLYFDNNKTLKKINFVYIYLVAIKSLQLL